MVKAWSSTGQAYCSKAPVKRGVRPCGDRAQRFGVAGGVAELVARAEMTLATEDSNELDLEAVRVLGALLQRPIVADRLVYLNLG
jgi:hypothetical protein